MTGVLIALGLGLAAGVVIGFVLGLESPKRCEPCRGNTENRHRAGLRDGWADGVKAMAEAMRRNSVHVTNKARDMVEYRIYDHEVDRLEREIGGSPEIYT